MQPRRAKNRFSFVSAFQNGVEEGEICFKIFEFSKQNQFEKPSQDVFPPVASSSEVLFVLQMTFHRSRPMSCCLS